VTATVIQFPKPFAPAIRHIDPVDELYALSELAERSEAEVLVLLDRIQRLLRESNSQSTGDVSA